MNNPITDFLKILRDNDFEQKIATIDNIPFCPFTEEDIPGYNLGDNHVGPREFDSQKDIEGDFDVNASDSPLYYELNGYSDFDDLEDYLNENLSEFKIAYIADGYAKDKNLRNEIVHQVTIIKNELSELKETNQFHKNFALNALFRTKANFCDEVISFMNNQDSRLIPKRQIDHDNPNRLKQKEVVILFYHLRELGLLGKNIPNNVYAQCISDITGYESEKIRQDLSNIKKDSKSTDSERFQKTDYDGIKRHLEQRLIKSIITDLKEKFPS